MTEKVLTLEEIDNMCDAEISFWFDQYRRMKATDEMRRALRDAVSMDDDKGLRIVTND